MVIIEDLQMRYLDMVIVQEFKKVESFWSGS
jgi:hypothetical protein